MTKDNNLSVDIYTGKAWEAALVKNELKKEGIEAFLKNDTLSMISPTKKSPDSWRDVILVVSILDYDRAKLIVADYEKKSREDLFPTRP